MTDVINLHSDRRTNGLRTPPHNIEIEQALLGAVLRNDRAMEACSDILVPQHFYAPEHRRIFEIMMQMAAKGQHATPTKLSHIAESDEILKEAGGTEYLFRLAANVVTVINAADYARTIRDLFMKRQLIAVGEDIVNAAYDNDDIDQTADQHIERVEQQLYDLASSGEADRAICSVGDAAKLAVQMADEAFKHDGHLVGVTTGFVDLDRWLGGLHRSDLLILAGRPAMGKTALATNIAYNAASACQTVNHDDGRQTQEGGHVLFFSLEMSSEQLAGRIISQYSGVSTDRVRRGDISQEEFERISGVGDGLSRLPLYIDDTPALSITSLRQRARRVKRQRGLHMIVVDYLQLIHGPLDKRFDSRVQEVSEITRGLKTLAKELEVPVLALSQLSRAVEQREDKRPKLSDLRESGSIEQDADVVSFVYRPEYYMDKQEPTKRANESEKDFFDRVKFEESKRKESENVAEFIIAKQRHGRVGTVELHFNGELTAFADLDRRDAAQEGMF